MSKKTPEIGDVIHAKGGDKVVCIFRLEKDSLILLTKANCGGIPIWGVHRFRPDEELNPDNGNHFESAADAMLSIMNEHLPKIAPNEHHYINSIPSPPKTARMDPETLSAFMNFVGEILNLSKWEAHYARQGIEYSLPEKASNAEVIEAAAGKLLSALDKEKKGNG